VSFIALGFILGDTHPHEGANQTADGTADSETGKSAHDRAGSDKRTDARNRKGADPGQQAQRSADHPARRNASGGPFRRFCVLLVGKVFRPLVVLEQNRNVVIGETFLPEAGDDPFRLICVVVDTKHRCLFSCHD
jgi:hypothetical protein